MAARLDIQERVSYLSSTSRAKDGGEDGYKSVKTPMADIEGGALREGGAPKLLSRECFGLLAQYACVGLVYGTLPGTIYPFLQIYLNVEGNQVVSARTLVVFQGVLRHCIGLFPDLWLSTTPVHGN